MMRRINVGCGDTPTPNWMNFDNSPSIRLAPFPKIVTLLNKIGIIRESQKRYIDFLANASIQWADATKHIPLSDNSVDVVYTSHMVEHLSKQQAISFFKESQRVLVPGGILRIVVPDISKLIQEYHKTKDADLLVQRLLFVDGKEKKFFERLQYLIWGNRLHQWMYDGSSLKQLLLLANFQDVIVLDAGQTNIKCDEHLNLYERSEDSVYVEAMNPR